MDDCFAGVTSLVGDFLADLFEGDESRFLPLDPEARKGETSSPLLSAWMMAAAFEATSSTLGQ